MINALNNIVPSLRDVKFNLEGLDSSYNVIYSIDTTAIATYGISIKFIKLKNKQAIIELIRANEITNDNSTNNHATGLALQCGKILYPIELIINEQAQITGINNHKAIINRWLKESPVLSTYYIGEAAENYIKQTEATIMNADAIIKAMQRDIFIAVYFMPLYTNVRDGLIFKENKQFHFSPTINMAMEQKVIIEDNDFLQVIITGHSANASNEETFIQANYKIKRRVLMIEAVDFTWHNTTMTNNIKIKAIN